MSWKCVLVERSDLVQVSLRRFVFSAAPDSRCALPRGYHDAKSILGITTAIRDEKGFTRPPEKPRLDDQRWPARCACGYEFKQGDEFQVAVEELYYDPANGYHKTLAEAPAGWMWEAWWINRKGPDGKCLAVRLPNGQDWIIDGRATSCPGPHNDPSHHCWTRTGDAPVITVSPSIDAPGYHGYLKDGILTDEV